MIRFYKSNPFYNIYLLIIITVISFRFLIHGSHELGLQNYLKPDRGPHSVIYLIIVPSFYLYHKNLVFQDKIYGLKDLKHLLFLVFLFFINSNHFIVKHYMLHYGKITNFILIAFFLCFYILFIYRLLHKNIWFKKDLLVSNTHYQLVKKWTIYLFSINVLAAIIMLISVYTEIDKHVYLSGKSLATVSLLFWLFIYFKILATPEILYGLPILNKTILKFSTVDKDLKLLTTKQSNHWILETPNLKNEQDQKLQEKIMSNIIGYTNEIDKLSSEKFIFSNPKITTNDLANALGVPTSYIVYLFKYHSKIPFTEYRMKSRIQHSISLIEDGYLKNNTLESLAHQCGFASYNPFFSAFKKETGFAPQEYLKSVTPKL